MSDFPNISNLIQQITTSLEALPDYKTATVRALRRDWSKKLQKVSPQHMLSLTLQLMQYDDFNYRFIAYELIHFHRPTLHSLGEAELEQLGQGLDSWYAVDTFAPYLAGPAWREGQIGDEVVQRWAASPDRWWRRVALVCTIALNTRARGGKGDTARTLAVCRLLVSDRDDMVVKAMSWALRELLVHDPQAVESFLAEHKDVLAARVLREVKNKRTSGLKNPRKTSF